MSFISGEPNGKHEDPVERFGRQRATTYAGEERTWRTGESPSCTVNELFYALGRVRVSVSWLDAENTFGYDW